MVVGRRDEPCIVCGEVTVCKGEPCVRAIGRWGKSCIGYGEIEQV